MFCGIKKFSELVECLLDFSIISNLTFFSGFLSISWPWLLPLVTFSPVRHHSPFSYSFCTNFFVEQYNYYFLARDTKNSTATLLFSIFFSDQRSPNGSIYEIVRLPISCIIKHLGRGNCPSGIILGLGR